MTAHKIPPLLLQVDVCSMQMSAGLAAGIAVITATTAIVSCYITAVVATATAEEKQKQDNPDTATVIAAKDCATVAATTATVITIRIATAAE